MLLSMDQSYVLEESFFFTHIDDGRNFLPKTEFFKNENKKMQNFLYILDQRHLSAFILMSVCLQDILYPISKLQNMFFSGSLEI